jgi:hypothetical protein
MNFVVDFNIIHASVMRGTFFPGCNIDNCSPWMKWSIALAGSELRLVPIYMNTHGWREASRSVVADWLGRRTLNRGRGFESRRRHGAVSLSRLP